MPELSPGLSALLDHVGSPDAAAREIADTPALLGEAKAAFPALQAVATAKAGEDGVRKVISRRFATYPQPARNEAEWDAWWADYFDTLADVTLASLEAGMRAYVADPSSEFMPKPGKLRELAFTAPCRSLGRYYRAKRAIQIAEEVPALAGPPVEPGEVRKMLGEFKSGFAMRAAETKPALPSIAGKPDETGITPAMREILARQRGGGMSRVEHIGDATPITAIYALCDPDNSPRYVGKTVRYLHERHKAHIAQAKSNPRLPVHRWIRKRMVAGQPLVIWLLEYVAAGEDWAARERYWIERFRARGDDLLNLTLGGEGLAGHKFTAEHREKIAAGLRTGGQFACETCGASFWRKRRDISRGNCRFCSRACYAASLKGRSRPVPQACTSRGVAAAAAKRRARPDCKRGHPLSGDNLFITASGGRGCKECRKLHKAAYRERARG